MKPTMRVKSEAANYDDLLIERIKNGDRDAYPDMVTRYWDRIFNRVHHLLKNQQDAEEVTQDAFIRAHRGPGEFSRGCLVFDLAVSNCHQFSAQPLLYWFRRKRDYSISLDQPLSVEGDLTLENVMPSAVEDAFRGRCHSRVC